VARIDQKLDSIRHYIIKYGKEKKVDNLLNFLRDLPPQYFPQIGHEFLQITCRKTSKNLGIKAYFDLAECIMTKFEFDKYYLKAFYVVPRNFAEVRQMFKFLRNWDGTSPEDISPFKLNLLLNFVLVSVEKLTTQQRAADLEELFEFIEDEDDLRLKDSNLLLKSLSIYIIFLINRRESIVKIQEKFKYLNTLDLNPSEIFYNKLLEVLTKNFRNDDLHFLILNQMPKKKIKPSLVTYNTILTIVSMSKSFLKCMEIFEMIIDADLQPDSYSLALLVRSLKQSVDVTKESVEKILNIQTEHDIKMDTVLCNSMIDVFMSLGFNNEAMRIYIRMKQDKDISIDNITFNSLIRGFSRNGLFEEASLIYEEMKKDYSHIMPNRIIFNSLMDSSLKIERLDVAMGLFMEMQRYEISPDSFTYSILLNGLKQANASERIIKKTLVSIKQILDISDFKLDEIFFNCILDTCSKYEIFDMMDYFYKIMKAKKIPESDITFGILIKAYGKIGDFQKAESLFNQMMQSNLRINNITYGCVLDACAKNGKMDEALKIFEKLKENFLHLNSVVFTTIIKGYINAEEYNEAIRFFKEVKNNIELEGMLITYNCGLDAYVRVNKINEAIQLFNEIETRFGADLVSYSTILKVFIQNEQKEKAYTYFLRLLGSEIVADISIVNLFLDSCANYNNYRLALKIYEQADVHKIKPNEITFGIMIKVYGFSREVKKAFDLIPVMKAYNIVPSIIVYTNLVHISFYNKNFRKVEEAYSMLKRDRIKGDRLLYSKLIGGFLRFKNYPKALKYLRFAHQDRCPIKMDIWEKLSKIVKENDPTRKILDECKDFKDRKVARRGIDKALKDRQRSLGKTRPTMRRQLIPNNSTNNSNATRRFFGKRNEDTRKPPSNSKPTQIYNFRKRVQN
jgi:pentatricopeptide repeat domain-containing protein 1